MNAPLSDICSPRSASPGRILLIDDERDFRSIISKSLIKLGFTVLEAADGKEGLSRAAESLPDLILCDLLMPEMDGYEFLAALRRDDQLATTPVIFLTGQSESAEVRQAMNLGADDYLIKPANIPDLLGAIHARLRRRQAERQQEQKQMERAMQLFAGTVHDLRNPLFAVLACANLLKNAAGAPQPSHEKSEALFATMQQAVTRMQDIISETMFVVRSRMRPQPLSVTAFDLRAFLELLLAENDPGGRLQFHAADGPCPVRADAPRLRHALENLLSNALKYSEGAVVVGLARSGEGYRIGVSDAGIGIPAEEQASIFEPFFRASNTTGKPGHGLGLCVVQSCIQDHGGAISFASEPNRGTTFALELPSSPPGCPPSEAAARSESPHGSLPLSPGGHNPHRQSPQLPQPAELAAAHPTVLPPPAARASRQAEPARQSTNATGAAAGPPRSGTLPEVARRLAGIVVEDDPVVRQVLRQLLEGSNGVQVLGVAGTVAQARLLASQQQPAFVFLDVNLPDGSGFDLLPDLAPNVAVVFVTGAEEYAAQAFDCEACDYLVKPVGSERLQKALLRVRQRLAGLAVDAPPADSTRSFLVKTLTEKRLVKFSEIRSILAYGEYSWVYWETGKKGALFRKSLKQWQAELPGEHFIRVHRRAIVNLAFLDRLERLPGGRLQVHLRDTPEPILVSLSQTPVLNRKLESLRR